MRRLMGLFTAWLGVVFGPVVGPLLGPLMGVALAAVVGWAWLHEHRAAEAQQLQQQQQQAGRAEYARAVDVGARAVDAMQAEAGALAINEINLTQEIKNERTTLSVAMAGVSAAAAGDQSCRPGVRPDAAGLATPTRPPSLVRRAALAAQPPAADHAAAPAPAGPNGAAPPAPLAGELVAAGTELQLSLGAVRLWDSALGGRRRPASLAADTCPADDPAASACALAAGITLRDAWLNHTANASRCAQDRSQLEQLIALLREREATDKFSTEATP